MTSQEIIAAWAKNAEPYYADAPRITFAVVGEQGVLADVRAAAHAGLTVACADLGIKTPTLLWFEPEGEAETRYRAKYRAADWLAFQHADVSGLAHRKALAIGLRGDLEPAAAAEFAAHEAFHLTQPEGRDYVSVDEPEAKAYGRKVREFLCWWDDYNRKHVAARVLTWDGYPHSGQTFAGQAEYRERLVAHHSSGETVPYWNSGSKQCPRWVRWHASFR